MIDYSSQNLTLGDKDHPAFTVHLRFEEDNFDYEHMRLGAILEGSVYLVSYSVNENFFKQYLPIFERMGKSIQLPDMSTVANGSIDHMSLR